MDDVEMYHPGKILDSSPPGYDPYNTADDGAFMIRLVYGTRDPEIYEVAP